MQNQIAIHINVFSGTPLMRQIAEEIKKLVDEGSLSRGDKLPSIREMARHFRVSVGTVRSAMSMLADEKIVASRHGSGFYIVTGDESPVEGEARPRTRETRFHQYRLRLSKFESAAEPLGIPILRRHIQVWLRLQYRMEVAVDQIAVFSNLKRAKEVLQFLFSLPHFRDEVLSILSPGQPNQKGHGDSVYFISMADCAEGMFILLLPQKYARLIELTMQATGAQAPLIQQLLLLSHFDNDSTVLATTTSCQSA